MSILSPSDSSLVSKIDEVTVVGKKPVFQKILEEDEYLGRMATIIRRDFFSDLEYPVGVETPSTTYNPGERSDHSYQITPGTDKTHSSVTSSVRSRREACSMGLNEFLEKNTSEDNAYFEKLQRQELRRHRAKYPWIYQDKNNHNKSVREQLRLPSIEEQASLGLGTTCNKMIDWPHDPKNSLFYAPDEQNLSKKPQSIINYHSNKFINETIFKKPLLPLTGFDKPKSSRRFNDKIGIDGKLLDGSDTPSINGFSFIPAPETPRQTLEKPITKSDHHRFYIPNESPRDELAHRVYQQKVARSIRTPKTGSCGTPSVRTPSFRRGYTDFSFSPERVKTPHRKLKK